MTTIAILNHLKPAYLADKLSKQPTNNISANFTSLQNIIQPFKSNDDLLLFNIYQQLNQNNEQYPIYGELFKYLSFIKQLTDFYEDCLLYQINLQDLPATTKHEQELKDIMIFLSLFPFKQKDYLDFKEIKQTELITIWPYFASIYEYNLFKELPKKDLTMQIWHQQEAKIYYRYALNNNTEIEGVVQDIILKQYNLSDVGIVCLNPDSHELLIHQLEMYKLNYTSLIPLTNNVIIQNFISFLNYALTKDLTYLCQTITSEEVSSYIQRFKIELDQKSIFTTNINPEIQLFSAKEIQTYQRWEKKYQTYLEENKEFLQGLLSTDPQQVITSAYNKLITNNLSEFDQKNILLIKNLLEECAPVIKENSDLASLIQILQEKKSKTVSDSLSGIIITDLTKPIFPCKHLYVLNANQNNFPNFQEHQGIFNENYLAKINYPSLEERYHLHLKNISWIYNCAQETLNFSYYTTNYDGKTFESALLIDDLKPIVSELTVQQTNLQYSLDDQLSAGVAEKLFFPSNKLCGSVSAFERYFQCPFSYFLRYGLRIKTPYENGLKANTVGTIQHAVLEKLVLDYQKDYAQVTKEIINDYATPYFNQLKQFFIKEELIIKLMQDQVVDNLAASLDFLKSMEANTTFTPEYVEYEFNECFMDKLKYPLHLRGIIDRIDLLHDSFRIIDYKSSSKSLQEKKFKAGIQLQLLSYLLIVQKKLEKKATGAYYYSLSDQYLTTIKSSIAYNKEKEIDHQQEKFNLRRLSGWTFSPNVALDTANPSHISGITYPKSGMKFKLYDLSKCEQVIEQLYNKLHDDLAQGTISLTPLKDACLYCDFKPICRFKGNYREVEPLVCQDDDLIFKEDQLDEVE